MDVYGYTSMCAYAYKPSHIKTLGVNVDGLCESSIGTAHCSSKVKVIVNIMVVCLVSTVHGF